jgi:hypothetical protein
MSLGWVYIVYTIVGVYHDYCIVQVQVHNTSAPPHLEDVRRNQSSYQHVAVTTMHVACRTVNREDQHFQARARGQTIKIRLAL